MSDRLNELLRQRAAIQAHLDWLDREIAHARPPHEKKDAAPPASPLVTASAIIPLASLPHTEPAIADADAILAGYRQNTQDLRTDVRKGCLLYFFGAFLLLGLGLTAFYFLNHLMREPSAPEPSGQRPAPAER